MVIWKECEHEIANFQVVKDPATIEALHNCGLLKYFRVLGMKAYIRLLEYIIEMWDPSQQHFVFRTDTLTIDIEDIYFLTGLSQRGRHMVLVYVIVTLECIHLYIYVLYPNVYFWKHL